MQTKLLTESTQFSNQAMYAPFVKDKDRAKPDLADMSLRDYIPKRLALNYEPPMISKSANITSSRLLITDPFF